MLRLKDIMSELEKLAPTYLAESWDNVGLMIGKPNHEVNKVLCALDLNEAVIDEAIDLGVQCIVTHHPFFFKAMKQINLESAQGQMIEKLILNKIAVYSMHTNYDIAEGGLNDYLAQRLGVQKTKVLKTTYEEVTVEGYPLGNRKKSYGIGRYGELDEAISIEQFIEQVKACFHIEYIRRTDKAHRMVKRIAICSGAGSEFIPLAASVADVYITGDVKFHEGQMAQSMGITVIDVGHYASECIALAPIKNCIKQAFPMCQVYDSTVNGETLFVE